jgi:hypothetical protein
MANELLKVADAVELRRRVARAEELRDQAYAVAEERTRERDQAERERDSAARALVKALASADEAHERWVGQSIGWHRALGHLDRIRVAAGVGETDDLSDIEWAIIERLGALPRLLGLVEAPGMPSDVDFTAAVRLALAILVSRKMRPVIEVIAEDASATVDEVGQWRDGESVPHEFARKAVFAVLAKHARAQAEAGAEVRRQGWEPPRGS